jgi:DNA polymerase III psi subunit
MKNIKLTYQHKGFVQLSNNIDIRVMHKRVLNKMRVRRWRLAHPEQNQIRQKEYSMNHYMKIRPLAYSRRRAKAGKMLLKYDLSQFNINRQEIEIMTKIHLINAQLNTRISLI